MSILLLLPLCALPAIFFAHLLVRHLAWLRGTNHAGQKQVLALVALVSLLFAILAVYLNDGGVVDRFVSAFYVFVTSLLYTYTYFHIFNMSHTARRIHILIMQLQGRLGSEAYSPQTMLGLRLARLKKMGCIHEQDGKLYAPLGAVVIVAVILQKLRRVFF